MACEISLIRSSKYYRAEALGEGSYGSVQTVYDDDGAVYALKKFGEEEEEEDDDDVREEEGEEIDEDELEYLEFDDLEDGYEYYMEPDSNGDRPQPGMDLGTLREISSLRLLSPIRPTDVCAGHPNVMRLHDVCRIDRSLAMIMPKMTTSLYAALEGKYLNPKQKIHIAHGALASVAFLHANHLIHRDIKTDNILLDEDMNAVLADFSLTKIFDGELKGSTHTATIGTPTYRAPEVVEELGYGLASDVWSVGVVLLEIFHNPLGVDKDKIALKKVQDLTAKMVDKPLPMLLKSLLEVDPEKRVTCEDALKSPVFAKYPPQKFSQTATVTPRPPEGFIVHVAPKKEKGKEKKKPQKGKKKQK